jgi:pSer/pThr/pTyr-binding forkhead associated (FHA) protein
VENVVDTFTPQQTFSIGRSPECDLVLADQSVSRKHAELMVLDDGQLFLVDCQSTHGTRLSLHGQTRPVQQDIVPLDAVVQFGDVSISMREIMQALREKPPQGTRLVRCRCGVIKVRGQRCPECGE